jgi:hypothetical protein
MPQVRGRHLHKNLQLATHQRHTRATHQQPHMLEAARPTPAVHLWWTASSEGCSLTWPQTTRGELAFHRAAGRSVQHELLARSGGELATLRARHHGIVRAPCHWQLPTTV